MLRGESFKVETSTVDDPVGQLTNLGRVMGVNLKSAFFLSQAVARRWVSAGRGGKIVNTASISGKQPEPHFLHYGVSKAGVIHMTKSAAAVLAPYNINVNAVCPGYIDTPMMGRFTGGTPEGRAKVIAEEPVGRMGKPEEIAAAVVWLCSDAAAFVVGHALVIDGGQTV